jgi:hypothetical protein
MHPIWLRVGSIDSCDLRQSVRVNVMFMTGKALSNLRKSLLKEKCKDRNLQKAKLTWTDEQKKPKKDQPPDVMNMAFA